MPAKKKRLGFTLLEILIAVAISGLLIGVGAVKYQDYNNTQVSKNALATLKNNLRDVQARATSGQKPTGCDTLSGYRLTYLTSSTYQVQAYCLNGLQGQVYPYQLPQNMVFAKNFTNFQFKVVGAGVDTATSITLKNNKTSQCYQLNILTSGLIDDMGLSDCPDYEVVQNNGTGRSCTYVCQHAIDYGGSYNHPSCNDVGTNAAGTDNKIKVQIGRDTCWDFGVGYPDFPLLNQGGNCSGRTTLWTNCRCDP